MLRNRENQQVAEIVIMEEMIPKKHLLRKIDRYVDFSFIDTNTPRRDEQLGRMG